MSRRVSKVLSLELISYVKKLEIRANFFNKDSVSAFEFARQMSSHNLVKKNSTYECVMFRQPDVSYVPNMKVEYTDGSIFEMPTVNQTAADLRALLYEKAEEAEEAMTSKAAAGTSASLILAAYVMVHSV